MLTEFRHSSMYSYVSPETKCAELDKKQAKETLYIHKYNSFISSEVDYNLPHEHAS